MPRFLFCLMILSCGLVAQGFELTVERRGRLVFVTGRNQTGLARDVLIALSSRLGCELRIEPGAPGILEGQAVPFRMDRMPATDFVEHLCGTLGLEGELSLELLVVRPLPEEGSPAATQWARGKALRAWFRASIAAESGETPDTLFRIGVLHLAGEEWRDAVSVLERFATLAPNDARAARALVLATDAALAMKNNALADQLIDRIVQTYTDIPEVMHAHLRRARRHLEDEEWTSALPLLGRVRSRSTDGRLNALAIILEAELWYLRGDFSRALEALSEFDVDVQRAYPDLADEIPLYEGLCLMGAGRFEEALPRLQLCLLTRRPLLRTRGALALGRACLALDQRVVALQNIRMVLRDPPTPSLLVEAHLLEAEVYVSLGLPDRALGAYEQVAKSLPGNLSDALHGELLSGIAELFFRRQEYEGALRIWKSLSGRSEGANLARYQMARCLHGLRRYQEALDELSRVTPGSGEEPPNWEELARLKGHCHLGLEQYVKAAMALSDGEPAIPTAPPTSGGER